MRAKNKNTRLNDLRAGSLDKLRGKGWQFHAVEVETTQVGVPMRVSAVPKVSEEGAGEEAQDVEFSESPEGDPARTSRFRYHVDAVNLRASAQHSAEMRCKGQPGNLRQHIKYIRHKHN
jgi:hypothetical protein